MSIEGRVSRASLATLGSCLALLAWAGIARAETVTVGPPLGELEKIEPCTSALGCGIVTLASPTQSFAAASPVAGTVVSWTIKGAASAPGYNLTVLRADPGGTYTVTAAGPLVTPAGAETETFPVGLPIQAGEYVEVNVPENGEIGALEATTGTLAVFEPTVALGETRLPIAEASTPAPAAYDAVIEATPTPVTPPVVPAAPPVASAPVAGPPAPASIEARCIVPKLNGRKLKAARKKIKAADCKLGLISKKDGVKVATGKVVKQSPSPGKVLPAKTGVSVKLG